MPEITSECVSQYRFGSFRVRVLRKRLLTRKDEEECGAIAAQRIAANLSSWLGVTCGCSLLAVPVVRRDERSTIVTKVLDKIVVGAHKSSRTAECRPSQPAIRSNRRGRP